MTGVQTCALPICRVEHVDQGAFAPALALRAEDLERGLRRAVEHQVARSFDQLEPRHVSLAKRNCVYWAREIARDARDILGANGVTDEYQCGRHMLNLESVYTYEGTHDIHTLVVGQDVTGLAAFDG